MSLAVPPTFIFNAWVQHGITWLRTKLAGWPRLWGAVELGAVEQGAPVMHP